MTTSEINALLALRRKSVKGIADAISTEEEPVSRTQVSYTINYQRENAHLRQKIADHLGMPVAELFDPWPQHRQSTSQASAATSV